MIIEEEFCKIKDKLYPCISFYGCLLGVADKTYFFDDRIKETHYIDIHRDSLFKVSSVIEWETKNGILIVKGKFNKPAVINLSLVDLSNDVLVKKYFEYF